MKSRHARNSSKFRRYFENLEERLAFSVAPAPVVTSIPMDTSMEVDYAQVAAGINYDAQTGTVNIYGTDGDDKVQISQSTIQVDINTPPMVITHVTLGQYEMVDGERTFVVTDSQQLFQHVNQVNFWGYGGNDEFYNGTSVPSTAHGGAGDDLLIGGNGDDTLNGDGDNDKLYARAGNDLLNGGGGNDMLFAAAGSDTLNAGSGDDVLVSIGGGFATLIGGAGVDSFWLDTTENVADASILEVAGANVHQVSQFMSYSFDGGQTFTPVGKELNGGNLPEPDAIYNPDNPISLHLENFYDNPLFAASGPSKDDVFQGAVGDCYFMASLSAIANADPNYIQQMVVDLGDGTYAVRFYDQGQAVYVRVEADLYVTDSGDLQYADLGQGGSVWVAIVEKAYTYFRKMQGSYASIASGNGTLQDHLYLEKASWKVDDGITAEQIIAWYNNGSPSGAINDAVQAGAFRIAQLDGRPAGGRTGRLYRRPLGGYELDAPPSRRPSNGWQREHFPPGPAHLHGRQHPERWRWQFPGCQTTEPLWKLSYTYRLHSDLLLLEQRRVVASFAGPRAG